MPGAAGQTSPGNKMSLSRGGKAVPNELESGGTKYPNRKCYHLAGEPAFIGAAGPQAFIGKTPYYTTAVHPGFIIEF